VFKTASSGPSIQPLYFKGYFFKFIKIYFKPHAEEGEMARADIPDLGTNNGVKFFNDA